MQAHTLIRITVFPIKSLPGIELEEAVVTPGGTLLHDREFGICDDKGAFINGKRTAAVHSINATFDKEIRSVTLSARRSRATTFDLADSTALESWFLAHFDERVHLIRNSKTGFPDDTAARGPTIVGQSSLETVATWFDGMTPGNVRGRFRANLEFGGGAPFWEDILFGKPGEKVSFKVGDVEFRGINPCQRCVVPSRDPFTGETIATFQKTFSENRKKWLPKWVEASQFNHHYRFCVNTQIPISEAGKRLRVGDRLELAA